MLYQRPKVWGLKYGCYTTGLRYGCYTKGLRYGSYTTGLRYGCYTKGLRYGSYTTGLSYGCYTTDLRYGCYTDLVRFVSGIISIPHKEHFSTLKFIIWSACIGEIALVSRTFLIQSRTLQVLWLQFCNRIPSMRNSLKLATKKIYHKVP